jgi:hypothetical protein
MRNSNLTLYADADLLLPKASRLALVALAGCLSSSSDDPTESDALDESTLMTDCAPGAEPSSEICGACAVIDLDVEPATVDPSLPNLGDLRSGKIAPPASTTNSVTCTAGGAQTGTFYNFAALPMGAETNLHTKMIVRPNGINNTSPCFIFTTATNRTQFGVEVLASYPGGNATPNLAVFDWSCSTSSPCGSQTSPSYVLSRSFDSCHRHSQSDGHGHTVEILYYANKTKQIAAGSPPEWQNTVLLWNYCTKAWNQIYTHKYHATQGDGGGWAPIIEPHIQGTLPAIKEVGYLSASLFHHGEWTTLTPSVSTFVTPSQAGLTTWSLLFRVPNYQYGVHGQ